MAQPTVSELEGQNGVLTACMKQMIWCSISRLCRDCFYVCCYALLNARNDDGDDDDDDDDDDDNAGVDDDE